MSFLNLNTHKSLWRPIFWLLILGTLWLSLVPVEFIPAAVSFWDKAQHALGFLVMTLAGLGGYPKHFSRIIGGLVVLGAGIEYAQYLTGWRQGDWADWLADCLGICIGSLMWRWAKDRKND